MKKLFIFTLILFIHFDSAEARLCHEIPAFKNVQTPRSLETLIERMDELGIRLRIDQEETLGYRRSDYYEIIAINRAGEIVGEMTMTDMGRQVEIDGKLLSLYTSHPDVSMNPKNSMVGTGLGTYLYAAAARAMHLMDGVLFSSTGPSHQAQRAWENMIDSGWALVGRERSTELLSITNPRTRLSTYRFNHDLLQDGFFNRLDSRIEDPNGLLKPVEE